MTNIIKFPVPDRENISYSTDDGELAVMDRELDVIIGIDSDSFDSVFLGIDGVGFHTDRKRLAEFLWSAAYMLDSEGRYKFDEYPAKDYKS